MILGLFVFWVETSWQKFIVKILIWYKMYLTYLFEFVFQNILFIHYSVS